MYVHMEDNLPDICNIVSLIYLVAANRPRVLKFLVMVPPFCGLNPIAIITYISY